MRIPAAQGTRRARATPSRSRGSTRGRKSRRISLTSEATRKQIGPEFFREHSIADLSNQSDNWLELQGRLVHPMMKRGLYELGERIL